MKKALALFVLLFAVTRAGAQNTEVYLFDLNLLKTGVITVANGINVSKHQGYDNQPYFHPEKPVLYYTSSRSGGQTDILTFDYKTGQTGELTRTPESEYSPTITPDGKSVSCIIMRDKVQDLGMYPIGGGAPEILVNNLTVGYHAWLDKDDVILFVLGNPLTLHRFNTISKSDAVIASTVGRSIHRIPGETAVSFIDRSSGTHGMIKKVDAAGKISDITKTVLGQDDIAWLPDGRIISSDGHNLLVFNPKKDRNWQPVRGPVLNGITRIAVSPDGKKIAVVVSE
mgnify:FL=1